MMPCVILVKHAMPEIVPGDPPNAWTLSEEGRQSCAPLAERLATYHPDAVVASREPKAAETGQLIAARLGIPFDTANNLHEHDRRNLPFQDWAAVVDDVERFFAQPDDLVFGGETAQQALRRFSQAVDAVIQAHSGQTIVVVAHGTVITLFVQERVKNQAIDAFQFWDNLKVSGFVVLALPSFDLVAVVAKA